MFIISHMRAFEAFLKPRRGLEYANIPGPIFRTDNPPKSLRAAIPGLKTLCGQTRNRLPIGSICAGTTANNCCIHWTGISAPEFQIFFLTNREHKRRNIHYLAGKRIFLRLLAGADGGCNEIWLLSVQDLSVWRVGTQDPGICNLGIGGYGPTGTAGPGTTRKHRLIQHLKQDHITLAHANLARYLIPTGLYLRQSHAGRRWITA